MSDARPFGHWRLAYPVRHKRLLSGLVDVQLGAAESMRRLPDRRSGPPAAERAQPDGLRLPSAIRRPLGVPTPTV